MASVKKKIKLHYAWAVLIGCTLMFFTITGLSGNCYAVYSPFIMKQYGYSKTRISVISSVSSLTATFSVLLTTPLYKKVSLRNGMLLAGILNAVSFGLFGLADSYPLFLAASMLKGFSYGLGSMVPIAKVIENWFHTKRTLCLSIVSAASGLATIGIPSVITWIIQKYSLHVSFYVSAVLFTVIYLLCWLIIRDDPAELGMTAYEGTEHEGQKTEKKEEPRIRPLPERWWVLLSAAILFATSSVTCYGSVSMLSTVEGYAPETVALVVSTAGASLMTGKLLFGIISTSIGLKRTSLFFGMLGILGMSLCCFLRVSPVFLFAGTVCIGLYVSMLVVGSVAWVTDWALPEDRAEHVKVFQSVYNLGCLVFGLAVGFMADACGGSYIPFYAMGAVIALFFTLTVCTVYRRQER